MAAAEDRIGQGTSAVERVVYHSETGRGGGAPAPDPARHQDRIRSTIGRDSGILWTGGGRVHPDFSLRSGAWRIMGKPAGTLWERSVGGFGSDIICFPFGRHVSKTEIRDHRATDQGAGGQDQQDGC